VLAFVFCAARGLIWGVAPPAALDEFCYLLAADTFASGRLTNPAHPMWVHFETPFVNQQPTYVAKYPPGQGLILALGQYVFGHPIVGVWFSTALASAAICWMLFEWVSPPWALIGAFLVSVRLVCQYWGYSYWGGSLAALGGALVFGSIRRIPDRLRLVDGLRIGFGLAIIANTRPYEGVIVCVCTALAVWIYILRKSPVAGRLTYLIPGMAGVLIPTFVAMGIYNLRTSGSPLRFPYQVNTETYFPVPVTLVGHPGPKPVFRNSEMEAWYEDMLHAYRQQLSLPGFIKATRIKLFSMWTFYLGISLTIPLLALPSVLADRWNKCALLILLATILLVLFHTWLLPHYLAPLTGVVLVLVVECMRRSSLWRWRSIPVGQALVVGIIALHLFFLFAPSRSWGAQLSVLWNQPWAYQRQNILARLRNMPDEHLVLVRYSAKHVSNQEWVYNNANIDVSKVVWARDLGPALNNEILNYYKNRHVWFLYPDAAPPQLVRFR